VRFFDWRRRFVEFGFDSGEAIRAAFSRPTRGALDQSRAELLPPAMRRRLDVVVDVGGNEGQWASSLARRLIAFEPNPRAMTAYRAAVQPMVGQLEAHQCAVGSEPGRSILRVPGSSNLASLLPMKEDAKHDYNVSARDTEDIAVDIITLDLELAGTHSFDLVKLDVQGFERSVLAGARETLRHARALLVEMNLVAHYKGEAGHVELWRSIEQMGFHYWNISDTMRGPGKRGYWFDVLFIRESAMSG